MRRLTTKTMVAAAALVAALTLSACTGPTDSTTPTATPAADGAKAPTLKPFDKDAVTAVFEKNAKSLGQPGAVMLIRTPKGEFTATYGVTSPGGSTPVSVDDHIRIGSNTKTWTGTVILQLVQEGKIALNDPVSKYRPGVPNGDKITIEQMLMMRSGLANYTETLELNTALDTDPQRVWEPEELVAMGLALPPDFESGTDYHYSNTNTILLGLIAEQLDKKPLSNTIGSSKLPPDLMAAADAGTFLPNDGTLNNPSWGWSAGSGISTAGELGDWVKALVGGNDALLDPEMQKARMNSFQSTDPENPKSASYGWNIAEFGQFYGHTGDFPGFNSFMGYDPVNDVTLVVWANLAPAANGQGPAAWIARKVIAEMYTP